MSESTNPFAALAEKALETEDGELNGRGYQDMVARAATALIVVHRQGKADAASLHAAIVAADPTFSASSVSRWENYGASVLRNGEGFSNRKWQNYSEFRDAVRWLADRASFGEPQ